MISVKRFSLVLLFLSLGGCASSGADRLPKMDASNYEAYADTIAKRSVYYCYTRVRSITQELEECTYQIANKYLNELHKEGKIEKRLFIQKD